MIDKYKLNTVGKVRGFYNVYRKYLYETVAELNCEISEITAPENTPEALAEIRTEMPQSGWEKAEKGRKWGGDNCYAWFRTQFTIPEEFDGKELLLRADFGAPESLLFLNGKPAGLFDVCGGIGGERWHEVQPLTFCAKKGETFSITAECYAGHPLCGCMVYESENYIEGRMYPKDTVRTYSGLNVVICNRDIAEFLMLHRIVFQLFEILNVRLDKARRLKRWKILYRFSQGISVIRACIYVRAHGRFAEERINFIFFGIRAEKIGHSARELVVYNCGICRF